MAFFNTGYKIQYTKDSVVDGGPHDGEPLDINNNLSSESGLPPYGINVSPDDPDFRVYSPTTCPVSKWVIDTDDTYCEDETPE